MATKKIDHAPFLEAADNIRRAARMLEGFKLAAETLEKIGSVDQALAERQDALAVVQAEFEGVTKELGEARAAVRMERGKEKKSIEDAKEIIEKAEADAKVRADALLADAEKAAYVLGQQIVDTATSQANEARQKAVKAAADLKAAQEKLESISAEIQSKQAQVDALNATLAEIKAKLA